MYVLCSKSHALSLTIKAIKSIVHRANLSQIIPKHKIIVYNGRIRVNTKSKTMIERSIQSLNVAYDYWIQSSKRINPP